MDRRSLLRSVALDYDGVRAPIVVAKGSGEVAARIVEQARAHGVHVTQDVELLELLARVEIGEEIPRELYTAVAVVLSWVWWLRGMRPGDERR